MEYTRISFHSFSYTYIIHGFPTKPAIDSADILEVRPKEIICITGPNGCGKTTFMNCLCGRLRPNQGRIIGYKSEGEINNPVIKFAYIPQNPWEGLVPEISIIENIALNKNKFAQKGLFKKAVSSQLIDEVKSILSNLGLDYLANKLLHPPHTPSGGEQQLYNMISAIISDPDIIIADEPTSKLDEQNRIRIWRLLYEIATQRGIPVICANHDAEMTERISDRIIRLKEGKVVESITLRQPGESRFVGEIRFFSHKHELPLELQKVPSDWWNPKDGSLFPKVYRECDNSIKGYLASKPLSRDERTLREVEGVLTLIKKNNRNTKLLHILDIPCGWGRHAVEFAKRGFKVSGIDLSEEYIADATKKAIDGKLINITFTKADMRKINCIQDKSIDVVTNLWTSFGFFSHSDNLKVISEFARVLKPEGQLIIHTDINPERVKWGAFDEPPIRELASGGFMEVREYYCAEDNSIYGTWQKSGSSELFTFCIRIYTVDEWSGMGKALGLELKSVWGGFEAENRVLSDRSQELILHFTKKRSS